MATAEQHLKKDRMSFRVTARQRDVISEAARASEKDLTAFVLDAALVAAQKTLADRTMFELGADAWQRFTDLLDRPAGQIAKPRLEKLLAEPSILEE